MIVLLSFFLPGQAFFVFVAFVFPISALVYFGLCPWLYNRCFLQVPGDSRLFIFRMRMLKLIGN